ncbi:hypothetical protein BOX15_Mlig013867g1, partial [Macrostomum lignano]
KRNAKRLSSSGAAETVAARSKKSTPKSRSQLKEQQELSVDGDNAAEKDDGFCSDDAVEPRLISSDSSNANDSHESTSGSVILAANNLADKAVQTELLYFSSDKEWTNWFYYCFFIIALFVLPLSFYWLQIYDQPVNEISSSSSTSGSFLPAFCPPSCIRSAVQSRLAAEFPAQSELLWPTISACLIRQFGSPPPVDAPSVLLLFISGVDDSNHKGNLTLSFLLGRLSRLLASGIDDCNCGAVLSIGDSAKCSDVSSKSATTESIDAAATEAVTSKRSCLAIRQIDQLTGPASLIFYRLADSTEAPHRPFLYVLTVEGDAGGEKVVDETSLQRQLRQTWVSSGLQNEQFDPLWARIGGNVVAVLPESENNLRQLSR